MDEYSNRYCFGKSLDRFGKDKKKKDMDDGGTICCWHYFELQVFKIKCRGRSE